ncbi:hypothetical protein AB0B63_18880 [Micromonospora sp. NPDC049081]|uniref:hypothetical protein n=1 Tax=Micromonospora sp. NPDC049081 TaxID=3155150 RepID=UPI0033C32DD1
MTRVRLRGTPRSFAALVAIALSTVVLAVAAPAQAAPASGAESTGHLIPLSSGAAGRSANSYGTLASTSITGTVGSITVTCTLTPSTPFIYYGGLYGGGEEGLATVRCTYPVYAAQVEVALFRYGTQITYGTHTNYSTTTTTADTEYPRSSGEYKTGADAYITWTYGGPTSFIPLTFSNSINL